MKTDEMHEGDSVSLKPLLSKVSVFAILTVSLLGIGHAALPAGSGVPEEPKAESKMAKAPAPIEAAEKQTPENYCLSTLQDLPGEFSSEKLKTSCAQVKQLPSCASEAGRPIFHFDKTGTPVVEGKSSKPSKVQNILVIGLIHGDEIPSGSVARLWMERLIEIAPRNNWRLIPVMNPDGVKNRTRTNGRGVDINRNFPTADWDSLALKYWKELADANERRFPGKKSASESETRCAIEHLKDFKPDFIISIHTPLGVLDFDGPKKIPFPKFKPLPWKSLGHYPGSLGRYMWKEHGVPVLTVEMKGDEVARKSLDAFDHLQDITGTVAIQAQRLLDDMGIEKRDVTFIPEGEQ